MVLSLTGPFASLGQSEKNGAELAAKQINEKGGVDGRKLELDVLDDASNPATAISNTKKLIASGSDAFFAYSAGVTQAPAAAVLTKEPHLSVVIGSYVHGQPASANYFWVSSLTTGTSDTLTACYLEKGIDAKRVGLIASDDAGAGEYVKGVTTQLEDAGVEVISQIVPTTATDVTGAVAKVRDSDPDVILDAGTGSVGGLIAKTVRQVMGSDIPIVGWWNWGSSPVMKQFASDLDGVIMFGDLAPEHPAPHQEAFVNAYAEAYPDAEVDSYAAWAYDAINLIAEAFRANPDASGSDGAQLAKTLEGLTHQGVMARYDYGVFDANDPESHTGTKISDLGFFEIQNGALGERLPSPDCS